jgi:large repetitive protein
MKKFFLILLLATISLSMNAGNNSLGKTKHSIEGEANILLPNFGGCSTPPSMPGYITGPVNGLCPSGIASATYSIANVPGATSYTWTAPLGATITSGAGTNSVSVSFTSLTSGNLAVTANNACGSSAARMITIKSVPAMPGNITGPVSGLCPSGIASTTYSIVAVPGATSYTWTAPTGATITSGAGTNSISVSFNGLSSGNLTVVANNACGSSAARMITIKSIPAIPGYITGPVNGLCPSGIANTTYSVVPVLGATSYTWTVPSGVTITSGIGTNSISVSISSLTSGILSVMANNACGSSAIRSIMIKSLPGMPGIITGPVNGLCPSATASATYSIYPIPGATSYTWTAPLGATITSGGGTNSVSVSFSSLTSGNLSVTADNACGSSPLRVIALKSAPAIPGAIIGPGTVLKSASGVAFSITAVTGATSYTWDVPSGATIASGQGSTAITVDFGTTSGNVTVKANNICGSSLVRTKPINLVRTLIGDLIFDAISPVEKPSQVLTFKLFPNPANNGSGINIIVNGGKTDEKEISIKIYDIIGNEVYSNIMTVQNDVPKTINTSFSTGFYIVELTIDKSILKEKLVINQ